MKDIIELSNTITKDDLIIIKDATVVANTEMFEQYAMAQKKYNEKFVKSNIGLSSIEIFDAEIKKQKTIVKNAKTYRTGFTEPLRSIASKFTPFEKDMDQNINILEQGRDAILEDTYQVSEDAIRGYLEEIVDESLGIDLSILDSFIDKQRKLKSMQPKEDGILTIAGQNKVEAEYKKIANPILEKINRDKIVANEQLLFEKYIPNIELDSVDALEAAKITLERVKLQIPELFSNIESYALNIIDSKIYAIDSSIKAIEADEKRKEEIARHTEAVDEREAELNLAKEEKNLKDEENKSIEIDRQDRVSLKFEATGTKDDFTQVVALMRSLNMQYKTLKD